ncbi:hypothetical protein BE11_41930 [Sorangium cellulosum]|nr:hypothetical protein BE11_41930 [Sorangium cellulosum]
MREDASRIAAVLARKLGAAAVKAEQVIGPPVRHINVDRPMVARDGLKVADVQAVVGAAVGGVSAASTRPRATPASAATGHAYGDGRADTGAAPPQRDDGG